jgi:hypothetical protein
MPNLPTHSARLLAGTGAQPLKGEYTTARLYECMVARLDICTLAAA